MEQNKYILEIFVQAMDRTDTDCVRVVSVVFLGSDGQRRRSAGVYHHSSEQLLFHQ